MWFTIKGVAEVMFIFTTLLAKIDEYPAMVLCSNIAISHVVWLY